MSLHAHDMLRHLLRRMRWACRSCEVLMRAHGGELTLEVAAGIGARAWLTLPRARVMEDQPAL